MAKEPKPLKTEVAVGHLDEFDCLHILEHNVTQRMITVLGVHQLVLRDAQMPPEVFRETCRSKMHCYEIIGKTKMIRELSEKVDSVEKLHLASYSIPAFFTALTEQMNALIADRISGEIRFVLQETSETEAVFDARRVSDIIYHLVVNAMMHGRTKNKTVEIRCFVKQHKMRITVKDYGGGFASVQKQTGLGLPFCRKLAQDMRGELHVYSYKSGTRVVLAVPLLRSVFYQTETFRPDDTLLLESFSTLLRFLQENEEERRT